MDRQKYIKVRGKIFGFIAEPPPRSVYLTNENNVIKTAYIFILTIHSLLIVYCHIHATC